MKVCRKAVLGLFNVFGMAKSFNNTCIGRLIRFPQELVYAPARFSFIEDPFIEKRIWRSRSPREHFRVVQHKN